MSEAGKVSLPTPERIQELKGRYEGLSPEDITFMTVGELTGLLAALEEAQQQLKETEDWEEDAYAWRDFCDERNNLDPAEFTEDNFVMMHQELQDVRQQIEPLRRNNQEWQTELLKAQQQIVSLKAESLVSYCEAAKRDRELAEAQQQAEKHRKVAEAKILFTNQGNNDYVYRLQEDLIEAQQTIARQREHIKGIHRIIVSSYSYSTQEQLRSVLTSAEWACAEALEDLKVGEGETQP